MFHKKIETKADALEFLRKGPVSDILNRLDRLPEMLDIKEDEKEEVPIEV